MKPVISPPAHDEPRVPRAPDPADAAPQGPVTSEHAALSVIGELSLEILHEMGNLWTGVRGIAHRLELLPDPEHTPEELIARLRTMAEAGRALSHQLQEVAHRRPETARTVALDQLVADTVDLVRQLLPKRFDVTLEAAPGEYRIWGVPAQLRLVLLTLVTNARDAIAEQGHLAFTLSPAATSPESHGTREARHIVLRLQDNGCGMGQERLAQKIPMRTTATLQQVRQALERYRHEERATPGAPRDPAVTILRATGCGAMTLRATSPDNRDHQDEEERDWMVLHHDLVQQVCADPLIAELLVRRLPETSEPTAGTLTVDTDGPRPAAPGSRQGQRGRR